MTPLQRKQAREREKRRVAELLNMFHHVHHTGARHRVHHCGNEHDGADYKIEHCACDKHRIDREKVTTESHAPNDYQVDILFCGKCPGGGWHIESGEIKSTAKLEIIEDLSGAIGKAIGQLKEL